MATETELKLTVHPQDRVRLLRHPTLACPAGPAQRLANTYFDTATLALQARRVAVRERRVDGQTLLTVKTAGTTVGGLSRRGEWEGPTRPGAFDFAALVDDAALAEELGRLAWQLVPVFHTDFVRHRWVVDHAGARIEVALDQGWIRSGEALREPILELELELLDGPVAALFDLAHTLALGPAGDAARGLRLMPAVTSKAERGFALFTGGRAAPVRAGAVVLRDGQTPREAWCDATFAALGQWQANRVGIAGPALGADGWPDPEFVHQGRVALRRLRSGLRLFEPFLPERFVRHWSAVWGELARALGPAREADVLATDTLAPRWAGLPGADALQARLDAQRRAAHAGAAAAVSGAAHALALLAQSHAALSLPPGPAAPGGLARWARRTVRAQAASVQRRARQALHVGPDGRHALRLAVKRLRYGQQFLAALLPERLADAGPWVEAQALLGELNDIDGALRWLGAVPEGLAPEAVAALRAALLADQAERLARLPVLARTLARAHRD